MRRSISLCISIIAWIAVLAQYYLMIQNRTTSIVETHIRFFSFFTILTNLLVAVYFTFGTSSRVTYPSLLKKPGTLTSITVYITVVGLVYQIILRQTWDPTGLQKIVDELLHSIIPLMVLLFWYFYEDKASLKFGQIPRWLIYPLLYLIYILIRGSFSCFYPYPFVNVDSIGLPQVIINCIILTALFTGLAAIFIKTGQWIRQKQSR